MTSIAPPSLPINTHPIQFTGIVSGQGNCDEFVTQWTALSTEKAHWYEHLVLTRNAVHDGFIDGSKLEKSAAEIASAVQDCLNASCQRATFSTFSGDLAGMLVLQAVFAGALSMSVEAELACLENPDRAAINACVYPVLDGIARDSSVRISSEELNGMMYSIGKSGMEAVRDAPALNQSIANDCVRDIALSILGVVIAMDMFVNGGDIEALDPTAPVVSLMKGLVEGSLQESSDSTSGPSVDQIRDGLFACLPPTETSLEEARDLGRQGARMAANDAMDTLLSGGEQQSELVDMITSLPEVAFQKVISGELSFNDLEGLGPVLEAFAEGMEDAQTEIF